MADGVAAQLLMAALVAARCFLGRISMVQGGKQVEAKQGL
jgi:hypothetical protein